MESGTGNKPFSQFFALVHVRMNVEIIETEAVADSETARDDHSGEPVDIDVFIELRVVQTFRFESIYFALRAQVFRREQCVKTDIRADIVHDVPGAEEAFNPLQGLRLLGLVGSALNRSISVSTSRRTTWPFTLQGMTLALSVALLLTA